MQTSLSASRHIVWVDRPFRRVLSVMPEMYDDLWTAAKGMYKLEPAMADGGEIVKDAALPTGANGDGGAGLFAWDEAETEVDQILHKDYRNDLDIKGCTKLAMPAVLR